MTSILIVGTGLSCVTIARQLVEAGDYDVHIMANSEITSRTTVMITRMRPGF